MRYHWFAWLGLLHVAIVHGQGGGKTDSRPTTRPASAPTDAAAALAERVLDFVGGRAALGGVHNLVFTVAGHRSLWSLDEQRVRTETLAPAPPGAIGQRWDVLVHDLSANKALLQAPPRPNPNAPRISAWSMWQEDTFRLLLPLRLLAERPELRLVPRLRDDPPGAERLQVRCAEPAVARGDWVLLIDSASGRPLGCEHSAARGRSTAWRFAQWTRIGPLRLALSLVPVDAEARGARAVEFHDVAANVPLPEHAWDHEQRILAEVGVGGAGR